MDTQMPVTPFVLPPCPFWGVQSKQESALDKSSTAFSKSLLAAPPHAGTFCIFCFKQGQPQVGTVQLRHPGRPGLRAGPGTWGFAPSLGSRALHKKESKALGAIPEWPAPLLFPSMAAETMKRYLNLKDAQFFVSVSLKSSCFWMCLSRAHALRAALDGSAFILTAFQVLIPPRFQVCHLKLTLPLVSVHIGYTVRHPWEVSHLPKP